MRKTIHFFTLLTLTLLLSACGGGSSTSAAQGKGIVVCTGTDKGLAQATEVEKGKTIKGIENNPSIRLWHLSDGKRKACVVSGSVEVL